MDALCVVIFQLRGVPQVDCESSEKRHRGCHRRTVSVNTTSRFAFVEYESRRDADDAYHEMHNKRLGRDDVLKIEVTSEADSCRSSVHKLIDVKSGRGLLHRRPGGSIPAVIVD